MTQSTAPVDRKPRGLCPQPRHRSQSRSRIKNTVIGVLLSISLGALGACAALMPLASDQLSDSPSAPRTPQEVGQTAVSLRDGIVESACFEFDLPQGYELREDLPGCMAELNFPGGDSLSALKVNASSDPVTKDDWMDFLKDGSAGSLQSLDNTRIAGFDAVSATLTDPLGLTLRMNVIFVPDDLFSYAGQQITAFCVWGYWAEPLDPGFETILRSLKIKA